jgi:predicted AAA+ superfamily ATPase
MGWNLITYLWQIRNTVFVLDAGTLGKYSIIDMDNKYISDLETSMKRRIAAIPTSIRPFTREKTSLPRAFSLLGPRGVGKTTFLLYHAQNKKILYFSADNPMLAGEALYEAVRSIFLSGYTGVIIDEVHFAKDWSLNLKALYDDFPEHSIWISDSSSLVLRGGIGDLSRRYVQINMPLLSFREFLFLETGKDYLVFDPFINNVEVPVTPSAKILAAFRTYRSTGTRPFYADANFEERLLSVLDKTLYFDIPFFLPNVTDGNLRLMKAITGTLAGSAIPRLQVRSLCSDWGIGSEKLYQILNVMESVGILRIIRVENDTKAKSVGEKLFFSDPAYYPLLRGNPGTAREALVASLCADSGWTVEAAKDETTGDFVITRGGSAKKEKIRIEVGGVSKKIKNADFVIRDDIDYPSKNAIPLWLLGMMY